MCPEADGVGTRNTRLVILRGNSGAGKSTVAATARERFGRGCALVEQDHFRRVVLAEKDVSGGHAPALIAQTVTFALDAGLHVICEGIMHAARYRATLLDLARRHRGQTTAYYLDIPLNETIRRHRDRPKASEFGADDMRRWYVETDLLRPPAGLGVVEHIVGADVGLEDLTLSVLRVLNR